MSNARAVFLFLIILLCMMAVRYRKDIIQRFFHYFIPITILIAIMYIGFIYVFWGFQYQDYRRDFRRQYSIDNIIRYTDRIPLSHYQYLKLKDDPRMGRLASIVKSFNLIFNSPSVFLFGLGPGNTQESHVLGKDGKYFQKYGSLSGLNRTQLSLIISEFGFLGIFLYFLFFWYLWKIIRRFKNINILEYQLISGVYLAFIILLFLFFTYSQVLNDYVVILILSYFIAVLQQRYYQTNDYNFSIED